MPDAMVKIRKRTNAVGSENSKKVIVDLFGINGEPVSGKHNDNETSADEIDNGNMKEEQKRMKPEIESIKNN